MVTSQFPPDIGGIQSYSFELARALNPLCEAFAVVAPTAPGAAASDAALPFQVHRRRTWGDEFTFSGIAPISRIARRGRFDVAFCAHWCPAHAALRSPSGWPKHVVCGAHGNEILIRPAAAFAPAQAVYDRVRGHVFRNAHAFAAVSRFTAGLLEAAGAPLERIEAIPNGVDPHLFRPGDASALRARLAPNGERLVLTVGRLVARKGVDRVIEALPVLAETVADVRYVVVGEGPERDRLEGLAGALGVAGRVVFAGNVRGGDLVAHYNACDLFVMPASSVPPDVEGFGLVFLEAGACGKPVIGSTSGGIPDAIVEGRTGLMVDVGDREGLAGAMARLLCDADLARRMGKAGRRRALGECSWTAVAERVANACRTAGPTGST